MNELEVGRAIGRLMAENDKLAAEVQKLRARDELIVAGVRELHQVGDSPHLRANGSARPWCVECQHVFPCPTLRALDRVLTLGATPEGA